MFGLWNEPAYYKSTEPKAYLSKRKQLAPPDVHIMNKYEAKMMRYLQSETGKTEEQVREIKKYRIMLSNAAKGKDACSKYEKTIKRGYIKDTAKKYKLKQSHPKVLKIAEQRFKKSYPLLKYPTD